MADTPSAPMEQDESAYESPIIFNFFGAAFLGGAVLLYAYQLSKMTNLFLVDLDKSTFIILQQANIFIFSLAYMGTLVGPAIAVYIGLGFIRLKKWLPDLLALGFAVGVVFEINNFVLSARFGFNYANKYELVALAIVGAIMVYTFYKRKYFLR